MLSRTYDEWLADGAACLEAAIAYLRLGWCPIPLCPPDHVGMRKHHCDSPGKRPLIDSWSSLPERPTEARLRDWWKTWPNANVGIVMGKISGMVGLDIDGLYGEEEFAKALTGRVALSTLVFSTPGGGKRLLFAASGEQEIRIAIRSHAAGEEFRLLGEGSQTVAPPSRHSRGGYYQWETPHGAAAH